MEIDTSGWSGEGAFTVALVEALKTLDGITFLRVEDAPTAHSGAGYNFISNEVYVGFAGGRRDGKWPRFPVAPFKRGVEPPEMTLDRLESCLASIAGIGAADYADERMLQYLRAERVVPPYQTRGYKLVEMVRLYEVENRPRGRPPHT
jgi:hypothetical protein